ncbi:MAG: SMC-Scp complex subunit ScpB [Caldilineaceae bacterium]
MPFKHLIQLLFAFVQRFFRSMNATQNAKPPISENQIEKARLDFHREDNQPTSTCKMSEEQAHQFLNNTHIMANSVEQPTEQAHEIAHDESLLTLNPTDTPETRSLPSLATEQTDWVERQTDENTTASSLEATIYLTEKDYIELGGEKLPLTTVLESILFVADGPVAPAQFARVLNFDPNRIESGLRDLAQMYQQTGRGIRLQERDGKFLLITLPVVAPAIEEFLNLDTSTKLSTPALETLAVIAYRQPITRMQIEAVRGVDSAGVLRSLVQRGLVEELGRLEVAGRPFLYGVTDLFMQHFGLTKIEDLPPLQSSEADTLWASTKLAELNELTG